MGNPQNLNRYAYVRNNPVRYNDPSGHCPQPPSGAGRVICAAFFIQPKNVLVSIAGRGEGAGDDRTFGPNSDPKKSRAYVWIFIDEGKAAAMVNESHVFGQDARPLPYPQNDITVQTNTQDGEYAVSVHATGSIPAGKQRLGSIDATITYKCNADGCSSSGKRDFYPWYEAYLYDDNGNVIQTIDQRPARNNDSRYLWGIEREEGLDFLQQNRRREVEREFGGVIPFDEWPIPSFSDGVHPD